MQPLKQLRDLVSGRRADTGSIVSVTDNTIVAATRYGPRIVQRQSGDATAYRPGDEIALTPDGLIKGRRSSSSFVYYV